MMFSRCCKSLLSTNNKSKLLLSSGTTISSQQQQRQCLIFANTKRTMATTTSTTSLTPTALKDWHLELGGEMVPFAGYELPVFYKNAPHASGVLQEHSWCRNQAGLFDVSHMGQIRWSGKDCIEFLERIVVSDLVGLDNGQACLSVITLPDNGGILDDTVITKLSDNEVYMVVNGATKFGDMEHFQQQMHEFKGDVTMEYWSDQQQQLLAIQGPKAVDVISKLVDGEIGKMPFMTGKDVTLNNGTVTNCRLTRCGYTGEDGFELSLPTDSTVAIAEQMFDQNPDTLNPAGLGSRDSLRLEAGLCLYGHDLNTNITPTQAALGWTIGPPKSRRRTTAANFLGAEHILTPDGKFQKVEQKRVGITGMKAPAREDVVVYDETGENVIGRVTSGTFSPTLKQPIAMAYVDNAHSKVDTVVQLEIRGKKQKAVITKMPFVPAKYFKG